MIQDISPEKLDNAFRADYVPKPEDHVMIFKGDEILSAISGDELRFPKVTDLMRANSEDICRADSGLSDNGREGANTVVYLFSVGDEAFLLARSSVEEFDLQGFEFRKIRSLRDGYLFPKKFVFAAFTAYQLSEWYTSTEYCGRCGSLNGYHAVERARQCPNCGMITYPRINPAVIIGVVDKDTDSIVLTKYRRGFAHNALVAGFTEIGETLEETVAREVKEEVGLDVTNIRYYKSQPWGLASDILAGFFCDVTGEREIRMDESELKYAEWVSRESIELQPLDYSLTNEMMRLFKERGYGGTCENI